VVALGIVALAFLLPREGLGKAAGGAPARIG